MEAATEPEPARNLLRNWLHFLRALRRLGLPVSAARLELLTRALALVGVDSRKRVQDAARSILASRREHQALFDSLFDAFFRPEAFAPINSNAFGRALQRVVKREERIALPAPASSSSDRLPEVEVETLERHFAPSELESLRYKDFADLTPDERQTIQRLIADQSLSLPPRRTRRLEPHSRRSANRPRRNPAS